MARLRLILVISWVCAGCATTLAPRTDPAPGAPTLRIVAAAPGLGEALRRSLVTAPPLDGSATAESDDGCRRFRPSGRGPDGLTAAEIRDAWVAGLRVPDGAHGWLLQPVDGAVEATEGNLETVAGLRVEGDELAVCSGRRIPDWSERLQHPALWPLVNDGSPGEARGGGAFRRSADGAALVRKPGGRDRRSRVQRIEIAAPSSRGSLVGRGEFELTLIHGSATADLSGQTQGLVKRLEAWDRVYALWVDPGRRWVNDPVFRRWIASSVDRKSMVDYLFGDGAEAAGSLVGDTRPDGPGTIGPPFSRTSSPRLSLSYDASDTHAASIAARIKAVLEREAPNVRVELVGDAAEDTQLSLLVHHPPLADAALGLLHTLWPLRGMATEEMRGLLRATQIDDPVLRRRRAIEIETRLVDDARLVPLVRLHAWAVHDPRLTGLDFGGYGVLRLERAEWSR